MLYFYFRMTKEKRAAVIILHEAKTKPKAIARRLKMPVQTVRDAIKRYQETGGTSDRPRSGRPVTACTPENVNKVRCRVRRNPERSMREMAKSLDIDEKSVRNIVGKHLRLRSYKLGRGHYLTEAMKLKRLQKARKMLRLVGGGRHQSIVFTDEKIFTVERHQNHQNDRQLLRNGSGMFFSPFFK